MNEERGQVHLGPYIRPGIGVLVAVRRNSRFAAPVRRADFAAFEQPPTLQVVGSVWVGKTDEMLRLDYISCVLTVLSTVLVGKKLWHGWVIAAANSIIVCIIGMRTAQFGFVPANLFCMGLYANNLWSWRSKKP